MLSVSQNLSGIPELALIFHFENVAQILFKTKSTLNVEKWL